MSPLDRWWEVNFLPTGETETGIGLDHVDHVSQSMQYEEMLTWLLF
jgi:4-hydroxyphenylpyruvate dioxygenase